MYEVPSVLFPKLQMIASYDIGTANKTLLPVSTFNAHIHLSISQLKYAITVELKILVIKYSLTTVDFFT